MPQLAAWLKHDSVTSGAFRLKVAAAKTFGLITTGQGSISLTNLGREIVDPAKLAQARVEAFLTVPLYGEIHRKYIGILLPNAVGLEREIAELGVAPKQTDKARQAFMRSAQRAGFFSEGNNKLVRPGLQPPADTPEPEKERNGSGGPPPPPTMHPFIKGLFDALPNPDTQPTWSDTEQDQWFKAARAIFKLLYKGPVSPSKPSEPQQPS
jgi:hypothetical protein